MEIKTRIIAYYSQTGHPSFPEDTWDAETLIKNEEDLYKWVIELHKRDSYHFNDYPIVGGCSLSGLKFYEEEYIEHEGSLFINPDRTECTVPYFESVANRYDALRKRMKTTIPALRKLRKAREESDKKRLMYEKLKEEFES